MMVGVGSLRFCRFVVYVVLILFFCLGRVFIAVCFLEGVLEGLFLYLSCDFCFWVGGRCRFLRY